MTPEFAPRGFWTVPDLNVKNGYLIDICMNRIIEPPFCNGSPSAKAIFCISDPQDGADFRELAVHVCSH